MDETIEKIVEYTKKSISQFGNSDQYFILEEVSADYRRRVLMC